jgi:hypothetical protein
MDPTIDALQKEVRNLQSALEARPDAAATLAPRLQQTLADLRALQIDPVLVGGGTAAGGQTCVQHCIRHQICNSHPPQGPILTAGQGARS